MKNSLRSIKEANIARRLLAIILDGVLFVFAFFCLMSWVTLPIAEKSFKYNENRAQIQHYEVFSKIYILQEKTSEGEIRIIEPSEFSTIAEESSINVAPLYEYKTDDIEFLRTRLKYYYLNYKTNKNIEYDPAIDDDVILERYYSPVYDSEIIKVGETSYTCEELYTESWFNENFGPEKISEISDMKKAIKTAVKDLYTSSYVDKLMDQVKGAQIFIAIPPFVLSFAIFYFMVPLLYKNGETLSKKMLGIGFVTKDGYRIKKRQMVFRQILLFLWVCLSLFIIGFDSMTSIATLGVGVVIYLVATLISKTKKSPVDYAAYTYLINIKKSVFFESAEQEAEKEEKLDEKMSKYRKVEPENKHLIQVGTTIVDEQVKKELEEEKLKKSTK